MNSVSYLTAGLMILDQNLSYQFDMSENSTKKVQTSPLFLNQIANFVTVNSEKTLNSHQITNKISQRLTTSASNNLFNTLVRSRSWADE